MDQETRNQDPRLTGRAKLLMQLAWLVIVFSTVSLYLLGRWDISQTPRTICYVATGGCTEAAAEAELARFGITPAFALGVLIIFGEIGVPLVCLLMALFIFWRRPDRTITFAVSAALAIYGPAVNTNLVDLGLARIGLAALGSAYYLIFEGLLYYVLLTFPNGRFVPAWGWLAMVIGMAVSAGALATGIVPLGQQPPTFVALFLVSMVMQVYRFRRVSTAIERQQSKWVLASLVAFGLNAVLYVGLIEPITRTGVLGLPYMTMFAPLNFLLVISFPTALMIASLRYRLWDIDVLIRRTLIYSALTALLALIYFGTVVVLQAALQTLTGERQGALVTVLSTLAIAALFVPLRRWVQAAIDRRFYRRKYDAAKIIAAFGAVLRDEVELDRVTSQMIDTVDATLQPAHAGVWLKAPTSSRRG